MIVNIKVNALQVQRTMQNAMNRTLTRSRNDQKNYIQKKHGVKKKYLKSARLKGYRVRRNDLNIKLTATDKTLTPFMVERSFRPNVGNKFGIQRSKEKGGKFFISRKNHQIKDWITKRGRLTETRRGKSIKNDYYYIKGRGVLDEELLKFTDELQKRAVKYLDEEINR
ncbi:hypothetical protein [Campylobacter ureolyticus]|uniref:Uncharacterized protein n=1 Tax=Campylobacter ureolyticus TaxID=827 RepID=A0AAE7JPL7_9BACT|nr:hypothetical protein [Campylobacter ureolyticus]MCR8685198.1 hypothetical protein [Campylobacter ureolyticus]QKF84537.1 hypothetical protein CURT_1058 [Campylobacter ureolyticus]QQY35303.1 hypothetical protein I6I59_07235 [Campylobacter ureolyticus]SUX22292.1 Uncharacterised protein [Campylobacter ureolyticus]